MNRFVDLLQSLLATVRRHRIGGWIALLLYVPAVIFPHDIVQYYANEIAIRYTHKRLYQGSAAGAIVIGLVLTFVFLAGVRRRTERRAVVLLWMTVMVLMVATWWIFMANNTELVHFPQYVPEGALLLVGHQIDVELVDAHGGKLLQK